MTCACVEYNETNLLKADLVIVDEVSMLDMSLMYHLFRALRRPVVLFWSGMPTSFRLSAPGPSCMILSVPAAYPLSAGYDFPAAGRRPYRDQYSSHHHGRMPVVREDEEFRFIAIDSELGAEIISRLYESSHLKSGVNCWASGIAYVPRGCGVDHLNDRYRKRQILRHRENQN